MMSKLEQMINKDGYIVSTKVMNALVCAAWAQSGALMGGPRHNFMQRIAGVGYGGVSTGWNTDHTTSHRVGPYADNNNGVILTPTYVHIAVRASVSTSINLISP